MVGNTWIKLAVVTLAGIVVIFVIMWGINQFSFTNGYSNMNGYGYQNGYQNQNGNQNTQAYGIPRNNSWFGGRNYGPGNMNGNNGGGMGNGMGGMR